MAIGLYISFATSICETKKTLRTSNLWVFWVGFLTVSEDFWGSKKKQQCDRVSVPKRWWWIWWETKTRNDGWDDLLGENWQCWDGGIHTQATSWKHTNSCQQKILSQESSFHMKSLASQSRITFIRERPKNANWISVRALIFFITEFVNFLEGGKISSPKNHPNNQQPGCCVFKVFVPFGIFMHLKKTNKNTSHHFHESHLALSAKSAAQTFLRDESQQMHQHWESHLIHRSPRRQLNQQLGVFFKFSGVIDHTLLAKS